MTRDMGSEWNSRGLVLLLLSSFFLALGFLFDRMPTIVDSQIKRNLELATSELTRSLWSQPPVDIHTYYWLYPITNAHKFTNEGQPVQVRKVGPFHFISRMEKRLGPLSANKYRITYNSSRHFTLNDSHLEQLQAEGLDLELTYLNVVYASMVGASTEMAHSIEDPFQQRFILSGAQRLASKFNESLFLNLTARQMLLGRQVPMLAAAAKLAKGTDMESIPIPMPPDNRYGLVSLQNNTWTGPFEVYTGYQASQSSLGDLISFQGRKRLDQFRGRCSRMQTSGGELRPMPLVESQVLEMFQPQMCRLVHLLPTGSSRLPSGHTLSYRISAADFASASKNPQNRCFCLNKTLDNYCSLDGVIEIAPCVSYAPIMININGIELDERITSNIANWEPDLFRSDPEPLPIVDPDKQFLMLKRIGIPFHVDLTITIFIKVKRDERFSHMRAVPEVSYIPVAMVRELVDIPPAFNQIFVNMESFLMLSEHLKVVFHLSSVCLLCWLTGHLYSRRGPDMDRPAQGRANKQEEPAPGSLQRSVRQAPSGSGDDGSHQLADGRAGARQPPPALIFSQVDKLRAGNIHQKRSSRVADLRQTPNQQDIDGAGRGPQSLPSSGAGEALIRANGLPPARQEALDEGSEPTSGAQKPSPAIGSLASDSSDSLVAKCVLDREKQAEEEITEPASVAEPSGGAPIIQEAGKVKGVIKRKNWVFKIYSNLLSMLGDIRQTINSAGQLDLSSDSQLQDKHLEMLADRIDNWQRLSVTTEATEPSEPAEQTEATLASCSDEPTTASAAKQHEEPEEAPSKQQQQQQRPAAPADAETEAETVSPASEKPSCESIQSDETIINSTSSTTNAKTRRAPSSTDVMRMQHENAEPPNDKDKELALKQMELALEFGFPSSLSPAPEAGQPEAAAKPAASRSRHKSARLAAASQSTQTGGPSTMAGSARCKPPPPPPSPVRGAP